jgi:hypothetical protein
LRKQAGKLAVLVDRTECVGDIVAEGPLGKSSAGDAAGLFKTAGSGFPDGATSIGSQGLRDGS